MPSNQHLLSSPSLSAFNLCQHRCLFLLSQFFASGGQSIGVSLQHQFFQGIFRTSLLGLTVLISLQSKGLWRVFSNTTALLFHSTYQLLTYYTVFVHLLKVLLPQIQCKFQEIWVFSVNVQLFIQCISPFWHTIKGKERKVKSLSHVRLCDPMDCSLPGSLVHGVFQASGLEWVAIPFSRRSSRPRDWTQVSHAVGRRFTIWATREVSWCSIIISWRNKLILKFRKTKHNTSFCLVLLEYHWIWDPEVQGHS